MPHPIVIDSIRAMHEHRRTLHAYCWRCRRWADIDLSALVRAGEGERKCPLYVRCQVCGERGQLQVRQPEPDWTRVLSTWGGRSLIAGERLPF